MLKLDFINVGYGDAILVRDVDVSFLDIYYLEERL